MLIREAKDITGGLSNTTKMPGKSWGGPAKLCKIGSKLRMIAGSVCEKCYAMKGAYTWPVVEAAYQRRFASIVLPLWVPAMARLITKQSSECFRWFDSGDLQDVTMLRKIIEVVEATEATEHWIATRELPTVNKWLAKGGTIPDNGNIRVSATHVNQRPELSKIQGVTRSMVSNTGPVEDAYNCVAPKQGGKCETCRACWDRTVPLVAYQEH